MMKQILLSALTVAVAATASATTYDITAYGAVSDTTVMSTSAIQRAIDDCSASGGGTVLVPPGDYATGSLVLRSNVNLHLDKGATIYGSTDINDYKPMVTDFESLRTNVPTIQLIYADNARGVSITGEGVIDGRGRVFPKLTWNDEGITRPHLLRLIRCKNVTLDGITLKNSGCWMQHYLACDSVRIHNITVKNRNNYNNDALDLDGCHHVEVSNMTADSDDDGITLKSTSPRLCEDVHIHDCTVSSHCNAIKLGTETNGGFRGIRIHDIEVSPSSDQSSIFFGRAIGTSAISLEIVDGGQMEDVEISSIKASGTESPIFIRLGDRRRPYSPAHPVDSIGKINNITLSDITVDHAGPTGCSITGLADHPVTNVFMRDISINHAGGIGQMSRPTDEKIADYPEATMWGTLPAKGFWLNHTRGIKMENIEVVTDLPDNRPLIVADDSPDLLHP